MALDSFPWINSSTSIFRVDASGLRTWIGRYATIDKVWWNKIGKGRVRLSGPLPNNTELNHIVDGDKILVIQKNQGEWDRFIEEDIILNLSNCQIQRKWMLNISPSSPDMQDIVILYVSIVCDIELKV